MIPALLGAVKAIGSMGLKKAATQGAKNFVKGKAKDFVTGKGKKKKTDTKVGKRKERRRGYSTPGQMVVAGSTDIIPTTPMVGALSTEVKNAEPTPKKKVSIESLTLQLENIVGLTETLDKITKENYNNQKKLLRKARTQREKDKKREREEKRESLFAKVGKGALGIAKKVDNKFNILNFFTQILLGSLALAVINNFSKIEAAFKWVGENFRATFYGFRLLLSTFKTVGSVIRGAFLKGTKGLFNLAKEGLSKTFKATGNLFLKSMRGLGNLATRLWNKIRDIGRLRRPRSTPLKPGATPPRVKPGATPPKPANNIRPLKPGATSPRVPPATAGGLRGMRRFSGITKAFRSGFRIPIIGPLIVGVLSYMETGNLERSFFRVGGAALGGGIGGGIAAVLGSVVPVFGTAVGATLGSILGEIVGEYIGDIFYIALKGGGMQEVGRKLKNDLVAAIEGTINFGKVAIEWVGDGFGRFYEAIPKFKLPNLQRGGINFNWMYGPLEGLFNLGGMSITDIEFPDPFWLLNPNPVEKGTALIKAFFSRDPMKEGGVKNLPEEQELTGQAKEIDEKGTYTVGNITYAYDVATGEPVLLPETKEHSEGEGLGGSVSTNFDFDPGQGDKSRKIFLHWTAGSHSKAYPAYHTTFLGSGKAVRVTPYGQDKGSHTAGGNKNSVGLSVAAMGGAGVNENNFGPQPPTAAQLDAMTTEAAQLAYAWGWDASTVESNVRTHGEWERYATRNGLLPGSPQRWDLDKLKQSDPDIDVSKVLSSGGTKLRSVIKSKLAKLKAGKGSGEKKKPSQSEATTPAQPEVERSSDVGEVKPISKPKRSDFAATRAGSREYAKAMNEYREQPKVEPQTSKVPGMSDQAKQISREGTYTVSGITYDSATGSPIDPSPTVSEQRSSDTMDTVDKPQPAEITSPPKPSVSAGVESQASYEGGSHMCCCDDESVSVLPPLAEPVVSGGSGGGGGESFSGGDVLNSLLKQQVLGFLYKQG